MGINTCLDTSGSYSGYEDILEYVDLVIWDVKALDNDDYSKITGKDIGISLGFLKYCQDKGIRMWIRQVIVPGINDNIIYINKLREFIKPLKNIEKVELLPYHLLGVSKYEKLGIPYRLNGVPAMDKKRCDEFYRILMS
jgi:pyruvate formate lyase activating enzyme